MDRRCRKVSVELLPPTQFKANFGIDNVFDLNNVVVRNCSSVNTSVAPSYFKYEINSSTFGRFLTIPIHLMPHIRHN